MDAELLSKEQVAELLRCEVVTVEEKTRSGEIPAVKIGRSWVYPRAALLQRLNELALGPKRLSRRHAYDEMQARIQADTERRTRASGAPYLIPKG
jgi:excisionase family DNA binding protein